MGKFRKLSFLLLLPFLLAGCQKPSAGSPRLVTHVRVAGQIQDSPFRAEYSDPRKMEIILFYLRGLDNLGSVDRDPERVLGDHFRITVSLSDGSRHVYHQRANRFLSRDSRPWTKIDPKKARLLSALLQSLN